uniref:Uncharacterized protein n=1 Tax=Plectus sambesii TaxID=2011161 RepID=A0A914UTG7_9BILA
MALPKLSTVFLLLVIVGIVASAAVHDSSELTREKRQGLLSGLLFGQPYGYGRYPGGYPGYGRGYGGYRRGYGRGYGGWNRGYYGWGGPSNYYG